MNNDLWKSLKLFSTCCCCWWCGITPARPLNRWRYIRTRNGCVWQTPKLDYTACVMALLSANEFIMKNLLLIRSERKRDESREQECEKSWMCLVRIISSNVSHQQRNGILNVQHYSTFVTQKICMLITISQSNRFSSTSETSSVQYIIRCHNRMEFSSTVT